MCLYIFFFILWPFFVDSFFPAHLFKNEPRIGRDGEWRKSKGGKCGLLFQK